MYKVNKRGPRTEPWPCACQALRGSPQSAKMVSGAPYPSLRFKGLSETPRSVPMDEFLKKVELVSNELGQTHFRMKGASLLTYKDDTASEAIKVTFLAQTLPTLMRVNRREYSKRPYVAEVIRCYRCHRLGHLTLDCKARQEACPTCGSSGNKASRCRSSKHRWVNCGGEHSAAYLGCKAREEWTTASGPKRICTGQWPSSKQRSWWEPQG